MLVNKELPIIVAEDSDEDFDMLTMTFKRFDVRNEIIRCQQGEEVLEAVKDLCQQRDCYPSLILLDLNLIGMDGREVLRQLKSTPRFRRIPIVVLSTSSNPRDVDVCYEGGANSYLVKPVDLERFEHFVCLIKEYWLENTLLPQPSPLDSIKNQYV